MATKWLLPKALGGGECHIVERDPGLTLMGRPAHVVVVEVNESPTYLVVQRTDLTEVKPPLPEEPPAGTAVRALFLTTGIEKDEPEPWVFERAASVVDEKNYWYGCGRDEGFTWAEVCALGVPTRLVPDPFAEPVELPWSGFDDETGASVEIRTVVGCGCHDQIDGARLVQISIDNPSDFKPAAVRRLARVLWAAADAAEKEQS